jgi:hypothetical protein
MHPLCVYFSLVSCQLQRKVAAPHRHHLSRRRDPYAAAPLPPPPPTVVDICDYETSQLFTLNGTFKVLAVVPRRTKSTVSLSVVSQNSPGSGISISSISISSISSRSIINSKHDVLFYLPSSSPPLSPYFPEMRTAQMFELAHVQPNRNIRASLRRSHQAPPLPSFGAASGFGGSSFGPRRCASPLTRQWMEAELFDRARYRAALRGPATTTAGAVHAALKQLTAAADGAPEPSAEEREEEDEDEDDVELPLAAAVLSPVERHFGECTVCYDLTPRGSFANFCFREFHIDAHSVQVRSLRARVLGTRNISNRGWIWGQLHPFDDSNLFAHQAFLHADVL